jgi:hypothetical protein
VVNLPPGGTLAETAATINAHLDVYPFASRADPPAAPPGPAAANSAAPGHTDQPTSPPTPVPGHAPGQAPAPPGGGSAPATAGSPTWPSAQGAPEPELGRGTSAGAGARPPQAPSAGSVQPGSKDDDDRSATSAETTGRANPSWLGEKSHFGSDQHHRLAKESDGIAGDPPAITYPAGVGAYTMPDNRGDLGTLVHQMVLHWLQLRLAARGVSTGSEIKTTPGGSNKRDSRNPGEVDLTIFVPDGQHPGMMHAQLYELKPRNPKEYRRYQRQVRKYGRHYHGTVGGFRISRADIGVALNAADSVDRSLFDPIVISNDSLEITIHLDLARDNNGKPIPGLIVYDKGVRQKRPGEDDSVERVKSLLKTDIRQTADAQAHGIARVGIITGGSIVTAMTAAQVLNLAGGALLAGAGAGAAGSAPIVGTASAGTAAANRVRIAAAVGEGVRIAETVDTGSTRLRIATEVLEEATEVLKQMQVKR